MIVKLTAEPKISTRTSTGQVLVFELKDEPKELNSLVADEITLVSDHRFVWKGCEKLNVRPGVRKLDAGYQISAYVQLVPPASASSLDLRSDWNLFALGTSYGFVLYDYANKHSVVTRSTLNVQDFAIVSGDAAAISRKKSFRKSLRESFRRLRRGRSQRNVVTRTTGATPLTTGTHQLEGASSETPKSAFGRGGPVTGVRALHAPSLAGAGNGIEAAVGGGRGIYSTERQVEQKVELSSIVKCLALTEAIITNNASFKPTLWVGTNSGQVLVYSIDLAQEQQPVAGAVQVSSNSTVSSSNATASAENSDQAQESSTTASPTNSSAAKADSNATSSAVDTEPASQIRTSAKLAREIQLKHRAPIIAIFTSPEAPPKHQAAVDSTCSVQQSSDSAKSTPLKQVSGLLATSSDAAKASDTKTAEEAAKPSTTEQANASTSGDTASSSAQQSPEKSSAGKKGDSVPSGKDANQPQARVLICSEEQFKVFNLPNLKPFCKFKLTAHEGLRAKKISITQFLKPVSSSNISNSKLAPTAAKLQATSATTLVSSSKSLQSFATQTSPPASPVPPGESADDSAAIANGASADAGKKGESNNNSFSALNNNLHSKQNSTDSKELLNAKFGATVSSTLTGSSSTAATASSSGKNSQSALDQSAATNLFEPYMVCMSNQGDCAIYSVPDLKRQAQIQVCKREDINGITSTMLTSYGEGFYLRSSCNFLRFSISSQRVLRVLSVV